MAAFTTLADLMRQLSTAAGPRLTWYGDERIELSGPVLTNWVVKTANLLVAEFDAGPGTTVGVDLPPHWRTSIWTLALWRIGATVSLAPAGDVVVTHRPREVESDGDVIAVALPALARAFPGELPAGATDAAEAVMTYGDQLGPTPEAEPTDTALVTGRRELTYADLASLPPGPDGRVLVDARAGTDAVLLDSLAAWRAGGSVVLVDAPLAAELDADPTRRARLLASEQVTA